MAVSYQWFIQWSPPSMVVGNIDKQYDNVDAHWGKMEPSETRVDAGYEDLNPTLKHLVDLGYNDTNYGKRKSAPVHNSNNSAKIKNGAAPAAALSLWMTMLGVTQPQSIPADNDTPPFHTLYKWSVVDFAFPSSLRRIRAMSTGKYIPSAALPLGLEVVRDRIFLTLPMWKPGVPATLVTVSTEGGIPSPYLKPYPNWTYHEGLNSELKQCEGLTSVLRVNADHCGRLWVLDAGQIDMQDDPKQVCPPTIFIFDTYTDQLIGRYEIPPNFILEDSLFSNIIVDTNSNVCDDLYAYISDTWRFGLLVFRLKDKQFWRFSNPYFFPDPLRSQFSLHGLRFQWTDGILGLSLSPVRNIRNTKKRDRILYFSPMSSDKQFYVFTSFLKIPKNTNHSSEDFKVFEEGRGVRGQISTASIDSRGVMFYGLVTQDSIGCWDTSKPYTNANNGLVATNYETLIFPNEVKVDNSDPQKVWVLSNRLPFFQVGELNMNDYNIRIMFADTREAVRGTICDNLDE